MDDVLRRLKARQIVEEAGCESLADYVADYVAWRPSIHNSQEYVAHTDRLSRNAKIVLSELHYTTGEASIGDGYYANDYIASDTLKQRIDARRAEAEQAKRDTQGIEALHEAERGKYHSISEYILSEIPWEPSAQYSGQVVAKYEDLTIAQMNALGVLQRQQPTAISNPGYHRNDYLASPELSQEVQEMQRLTKSFVDKLNSQSRSGGHEI